LNKKRRAFALLLFLHAILYKSVVVIFNSPQVFLLKVENINAVLGDVAVKLVFNHFYIETATSSQHVGEKIDLFTGVERNVKKLAGHVRYDVVVGGGHCLYLLFIRGFCLPLYVYNYIP
jgi:hypothetical protein